MESLVDIVTTVFQAVLAVAIVFTAGYAVNSSQDVVFAKNIAVTARRLLLPALIFTTLSATTLTWRTLLMQWPSVIIALTTHLASLAYGLICLRWNSGQNWLVESLTINNVSSYPLLALQALYHLSTGERRGLYHLKWRVMDPVSSVYTRSIDYIVINILITYVARQALTIVLPQLLGEKRSYDTFTDEDGASEIETPETPIEDDEEPTERSRLIGRGKKSSPANRLFQHAASHVELLAGLIGLLIGLVKPIQRALVGTQDLSTGGWSSIGGGLMLLAAAYATVDMLSIGAGMRAGEKKPVEQEVPPSLGLVLVTTFWRFIVVPAIVLPIIYGFHKIPSTRAFLQDPAYSFILVLTSVTPPAWPAQMTPLRSNVHLWLHYVALITPVPLAIAIGISGRGVSYESDFDVKRALKLAVGGGVAGAAAMVIQVLALMPMRTIMNYQYRYGGAMIDSAKKLYQDGGIKRYYAGLGAALFQAPLSRFGDTAANAGILALLESLTWPVLIKTIVSSMSSAAFRMTLTPIDTLKTTQQTRGGKAGLKLLRERIKENGIGCLWWGALATAAATFVGNYPWFGTYNFLSEKLPIPHNLVPRLFRQAFIGFAASVVSDTISNSLRVVKTYRQVHEKNVGYLTAAKEIVAAEGVLALFGRGLPTRLITNGLQGLLFSVLWKLFSDILAGDNPK